MTKTQIICLFILYKPQTVLSILAFIWNSDLLFDVDMHSLIDKALKHFYM